MPADATDYRKHPTPYKPQEVELIKKTTVEAAAAFNEQAWRLENLVPGLA